MFLEYEENQIACYMTNYG